MFMDTVYFFTGVVQKTYVGSSLKTGLIAGGAVPPLCVVSVVSAKEMHLYPRPDDVYLALSHRRTSRR